MAYAFRHLLGDGDGTGRGAQPETSDMIVAIDAPSPYRLWRAASTCMPSADVIRLLSSSERATAASLAFERARRRYLAAHLALRYVLASCVAIAPEDLCFAVGAAGKPALVRPPSCHFSLSRSGDIAVIAEASGAPVGVDVELERAVPDAPALAARYFTPAECEALSLLEGPERDVAFLRCWTRKEACLKAIGCGLSIEPRLFEVGTMPRFHRARVPTATGPVQVAVESLVATGNLVVSIARVAA